ncbi:MAG: HAD-IIIA family hydrolase [Candidatus Omnitrophica bacterium]|nr:HAD-IIIA family hydrolase [Candidatus Omnitrophota bacterium]
MIEDRAKKIKLLILDVDGVLTDGRIIYDNFGDEIKCFSVYDGFGMTLLYRAGIKSVIITAKKTRIVERRAKDMHVANVYSGYKKLKIYEKVIKKFRVKDEEVCFMGDDLIDLPVLKRAGLSVAPPEAIDEVKTFCHYVTKKSGGKSAVRELIEIILKSQGLWHKVTAEYVK